MNILMTADAVGGVWTYALELAAALAPSELNITLAVMGPSPSAAQRQAAQQLRNLQLVEHAFRLEWMNDPWRDVDAAGDWLLSLASHVRADLIHLNGYSHAALPWRVPVLSVAHSCVLSWWHAVHGVAAPHTWHEYRQRVGAGLAAASHVVAPTAAYLHALRRHYSALPDTSVIHNARRAVTSDANGMQRHLVFSAGRLWDPAKDILTLDDAARDLPWPVFVAGDTRSPQHREIRLIHAHALGVLSAHETAQWCAHAGVYVSTAVYEPFGLAVLEAALHGCALVLGDIPTLRELWGDAAVFVPVRDSSALHAALVGLIADNSRLTALAQAARRRAAHFNPQRMSAAYLKLYRQLTAAHHAGGSQPAAALARKAHEDYA